MLSGVLAVASALGVATLGNVELASGFGGGKILGGKGVRYTNVVGRPAMAQPIFAQPWVGEPLLRASDEPLVGRTPFHGSRAAVSGDIVGAAPIVPVRANNVHNTGAYQSTGTMLGESLGLVPSNVGDGVGLGSGGLLNTPLMSTLQYPGFPSFESDGYIIHDQRGRDASTCPPGGCGEAGTMSADMQSMYDKYKRYYRSFGPGSRAAPAPGRLIDNIPVGQYSRLNSGLAQGGSHFVASPLLDGRASRNSADRMPAAVSHYARDPVPEYVGHATMDSMGVMRGQTDRVALGTPSQPRDSFFGKIYDEPSHLGEDPDIDHELIYDGTRRSASPYAAQYYGGAAQGGRAHRYVETRPDEHSDRFEDLPKYTGETGKDAKTTSSGGVGSGARPLADRLADVQEKLADGSGRIAGGGLVNRLQDFAGGDVLDNVGLGNLGQDILQ